jgi:hypothetical protein
MAHGPKSKQRNARRARVIKHFAQKLGISGRSLLVDFVATALATAVMSLEEAPNDVLFHSIVNITGEKLVKHGLPFDAAKLVINEAVNEFARAFSQA